jgi:hypothetical protein
MIMQYILTTFKLFPSFVIDLKPTLLKMLQEAQSNLFNHVCFVIGEAIATCPDDSRLNTSIIVQYYEMLELVTYEKIAKTRMEKEEVDVIDPDAAMKVQAFNILIGSMCKVCQHLYVNNVQLAGKCPDLVPRVTVCLVNLLRHTSVMHASVIQRANESIKLLRYPSIVTTLLCNNQRSTQPI